MVQIDWVRIQNFRSIIDSGNVNLDPDITTLVGPNEAGKTNFLKALHKFDPQRNYAADDLSFYVDDIDPESEKVPIVSVRISDFPLERLKNRVEPEIREGLEDDTDDITLTKYFDGGYDVELGQYGDLISELSKSREERRRRVINQLVSTHNNIEDNIRNSDSDLDMKLISSSALRHSADSDLGMLNDRIDRLKEQLKQLKEEGDEDLLSQIRGEIARMESRLSLLDHLISPASRIVAKSAYNAAFKKGADLIQDEVTIEDVQDKPEDTFYSDILEFAGINVDEFYSLNAKERYDRKHAAAVKLEEGFNQYWPREDSVEFELSFGGDSVSLHMMDGSGSTDLATHRSTGFRHFLSFYIRLIASSGEELEDNLLLLDGPGIHLHPEGQKKLKEALENIAEDNQVIYSTHSPFMIDSNHIGRVRVLRQDLDDGTKILSDLDRAAQNQDVVDVLSPVRASIGANFADSLFASSANILVEGYTDKRYIEAFSELFKREEDRENISYGTNVIDVDGSKADYLAKILDAEGYEYIILLDSDQGGDQHKENLIEKGINPDQIHTLRESVPALEEKNNATIEDLFSREFYGEQLAEVHDEIEIDDIQEVLDEDSRGIINSLESRLNELHGRGQIEDPHVPKGDVADLISQRVIQNDNEEEIVHSSENFQSLIQDITSKI